MKNLILEGFMGCGKSSAAEMLSKELSLELCDTDSMIEKAQKMTINEIFEKEGESAFRDMETALLEELGAKTGPCVISLGGGMPVRAENRALLKKLGTVIYLKAPLRVLVNRLEKEHDNRPMLRGYDLEERIGSLLKEREGAYLEAADFTIGVTEGMKIGDTVSCIRKACGL